MTSPRGKKRKVAKSGALDKLTIETMESEKCLTPLTVKLGACTATFVKKHGGSSWVRKAIIEKLKRGK